MPTSQFMPPELGVIPDPMTMLRLEEAHFPGPCLTVLARSLQVRIEPRGVKARFTFRRSMLIVPGYGFLARRARERMKIEESSQPRRVARLSHQSITSPPGVCGSGYQVDL
jgi:hypothetical protein